MTDDVADLPQVWQQVVADLSPSLSSHHRAWLSITDLVGLIGTTALIAAPSGFARDTIERTLREPITAALSHRMQLPISLAVTVSENAANGSAEPEPPINANGFAQSGANGNGPSRARAASQGFRLLAPSRGRKRPGVGKVRNAVERCHNIFAQCG